MSCSPSAAAIACTALGKGYPFYNAPKDRLLDWLLPHTPPRCDFFWALRDLSLTIKHGQTVGVIGRNGSGKSTFLQLVAGVLQPTEGTIQTTGRIAALLELGTGFNPEFTGRENIRLAASLLGLLPDEIEARLPDISGFADIGEFFDYPLRTYSSGMQARLAFALVTNVDADILIVDEALAVGDAAFAQKCMRYLRHFRERGTLCFVSHDAAAVMNLCETALWLDSGTVKAFDQARLVCREYAALVQGQTLEEMVYQRGGRSLADAPQPQTIHPLLAAPVKRSDECRITDAALLDEDGRPVRALQGGERLTLMLGGQVQQRNSQRQLQISFIFKDRLGQALFGASTPIECNCCHDAFAVSFRFSLPKLRAGDFAFAIVLASKDESPLAVCDRLDEAIVIRVDPPRVTHGLLPIDIDVSYTISSAHRQTSLGSIL